MNCLFVSVGREFRNGVPAVSLFIDQLEQHEHPLMRGRGKNYDCGIHCVQDVMLDGGVYARVSETLCTVVNAPVNNRVEGKEAQNISVNNSTVHPYTYEPNLSEHGNCNELALYYSPLSIRLLRLHKRLLLVV